MELVENIERDYVVAGIVGNWDGLVNQLRGR